MTELLRYDLANILPVSVKETLLWKRGQVGFQTALPYSPYSFENTKSGTGFQFLLLGRMAKAHGKGVIFSQTPVVLTIWACLARFSRCSWSLMRIGPVLGHGRLSGSCRRAIIGVPRCLRGLRLFSTCLNMILTNTSPQAKHAETDPSHGTPTMVHFRPPELRNRPRVSAEFMCGLYNHFNNLRFRQSPKINDGPISFSSVFLCFK